MLEKNAMTPGQATLRLDRGSLHMERGRCEQQWRTLLAEQFWASDLSFLSLCLLIYKMRPMIESNSSGCTENEMKDYPKGT